MKTSSSIVIAVLIVVALAVSTAVTLFVAAAPYLVLLTVVFAIGRASRRRAGSLTAVQDWPGAVTARPSAAVGGSGWVLIPVWMGSSQQATRTSSAILDAEVIDDRRWPR